MGHTESRPSPSVASDASADAAAVADTLAREFGAGALAHELLDFPVLAATLCDAPMAAFSLIGSERQHLVARLGIDVADTPRELAFCSYTLTAADLFEVTDTAADRRFAANPLVTGPPRIGAYAGIAIADDAGRKVGSLFVAWHQPRQLAAAAIDGLRRLARQLARRVQLHAADAERARIRDAARESERRYRRALEALDQVAVQAYRLDGRITFWNRASESLYGWTAAEALGADIVALLHPPEARVAERALMAQIAESGDQPAAGEVEVRRRDGSSATIYATRVLVRSADGEPEFFCFDVDITARRAAEDALRASEERLRAIADSIPGALFRYVLHPDGSDHIVYMSRGCAEIWELDAAAVLSDPAPLWAMILPEDLPAMRDSVLESARAGAVTAPVAHPNALGPAEMAGGQRYPGPHRQRRRRLAQFHCRSHGGGDGRSRAGAVRGALPGDRRESPRRDFPLRAAP